MAGRKGTIPKETLKTVICKYKEIFQAEIPPTNDSVYVDLQQELRKNYKCNMTNKALQTCIKRNKTYFFHLDNNINLCKEEETDFYVTTFEMTIAEYLSIVPKNLIYRLLPRKWTNELQDQIFFKSDIECTFAFNYSYVPSDFNFNDIRCTGRCIQCNARLSLKIAPPSNNCVRVTCELSSYKKDFTHDPLIKNKLTSDRIKKYKEKLKYEKALKVLHTMADEVMIADNPKKPTTFPKLSNLRKLRHQARSALQFDKNPILSLYAMAHCTPYNSYIHKISLVPFYIYFWTNEQTKYYNETLKYKVLSIDATGSLFQPIEPPPSNDLTYRTNKHLFLYAVVAYAPNSSIPICYMASESHTMETIATWLNTWHSRNVLPDEIISDDSSAIQGAISKVFLKMEFNDYLKQCFELLEGKTTAIPVCYIRLDKSHFIKKLYKQTCFDKASEKVKLFYINCVKYIQQLRCYKELKTVLKDIVILSLHEFRSADLNNTQPKCDKALESLKLRIVNDTNHENFHDINTQNDMETKMELLHNEDDKNVSIPLINFYDDLIQTEKLYLQLVDATHSKNEYFLPELNSTLKRLLKKLPLWGCVMNKYFKNAKDYASSSNVENHFKDLKTIYFDTKNQRVRLDEFLVLNYGFVNGSVKLSSSDVVHKTDSNKITQPGLRIKRRVNKRAKLNTFKCKNDDFDDQSIFQDNPIKIENWRGLAVSTSRSYKPKPIHILQNGNVANSKTTENRIIITNTCAFDSVSQSFAIAYKDRENFKESVDIQTKKEDCDVSCQFLLFIRELSNSKNCNNKLYDLRAKLLLQLFKNSNTQYVVDCSCNATKILDEICKNILFVSAIRQRLCSNSMCPSNADRNKLFDCKYLPLNLDIINIKGIKYLQEACESCLKKEFTPECYICHSGNVSFTYDVKDIIIFELHDICIALDDLPLNIEINNKEYTILSVIEYQPALNPESIGHYRAHCYRKKCNCFECYDDIYSKIQQRGKSKIIPHVIIYIA